MLPERSKRYAGIDGEIPRLTLASNWQLALVALLVLALLVLIFPRTTLVEKLYEQETLDALTQSYVRNLYRADSKNADAAILLTKTELETLDLKAIETRLLPWIDAPDPRQRMSSWVMLTQSYQKALAAKPAQMERKRLIDQLTKILARASRESLRPSRSRFFATVAFEANLPRLGLTFLKQVDDEDHLQTLEHRGTIALGQGDLDAAAEYFLMARDLSSEPDQARRLFQQGINAAMAASRFTSAMQLAQAHLGDLAHDPATLRFLTRTALAAADPLRAAEYARRLVFQVPETEHRP